jgi:hypothetical protein
MALPARDPARDPPWWPRLDGTHVAGVEKSRSEFGIDRKRGRSVNAAALIETNGEIV